MHVGLRGWAAEIGRRARSSYTEPMWVTHASAQRARGKLVAEASMDDTNERIIEYDFSVRAWRFQVEIPLDGNTYFTVAGYRLSRDSAREAVNQIRSLGIRKLYWDKQRESPW